MTDAADQRLDALFAADAAPAHDAVFEAQVMTRVEERRTITAWTTLAAYGVLGVLIAILALPALLNAFGLGQLFAMAWPVLLSAGVTVACMASAWRYLKPLTDWRSLLPGN